MSSLIHIVLCAYEPNLDFLALQLQSIVAQTHTRWTCEICLDRGMVDRTAEIRQLIADEPRFSLSVRQTRLGVFHNFEAGLLSAPSEAEFLAYCDQDDEWIAEKLAAALAAFGDPQVMLVHSDLEAVDADGRTIHNSCFRSEKRVVDDFSVAQLVLRNSVTGCTTVFRRAVLQYLLPFPAQGLEVRFHHDLWTALIARQCGAIVAIDKPLVRYRQHGGNVVGVEVAKRRLSRAPFAVKARVWLNNWTLREALIQELLARPAGTTGQHELTEVQAWLRHRYVDLRLLKRTVTLLISHYPAGEVALQTALGKIVNELLPMRRLFRDSYNVWRSRSRRAFHLAKAVKRFVTDRSFRRKVHDMLARLGPSGTTLPGPQQLASGPSFQYGEQYLEPIPLTFSADHPRAVIVVPTARTDFIYGGLTTAFRLGVTLAQNGVPIRFLSIDHHLNDADVRALTVFLKDRCGYTAGDNLIEIHSAVGQTAPAHHQDIFIATIWWSARRIFHTLEKGQFTVNEFYYLIQDFEPGFYAWSNEYALAQSTYGMACRPIVNTTFLAEHLRKETGLETSSRRIFNPEIEWTRFQPPSLDEIDARMTRRVLFYGRPGTPRNLFDVGLAALRRLVKDLKLSPEDIVVVSAGESHETISLGNNILMESVGKLSMEEYAAMLRQSDIGLSLMLSPHPSYPPFEMAASGMVAVTNDFSTKQMEFGSNIISTEAAPESIAAALQEAWRRSFNTESRIAAAKIDTSCLGRSLTEIAVELAPEMRELLAAKTDDIRPRLFRSHSRSVGLDYHIVSGEQKTFAGERVCMVAHFDVHGTIDAHVLNYLSALASEGYKLILISSNWDIDASSLSDAMTLCDVIIQRENKGLDFAGWALAFRLFPSLFEAEELVTTNDSVYGPIRPLSEVFAEMKERPCDFWGITESLEVEWHLQSYFLVFRRTCIASSAFRDFWDQVRALPEKEQVIRSYEVTIARTLANAGLRPGVLVELDTVTHEICNPTLNPWKTLLVKGKSPFIKVQLLRDNPLQSDIRGWQDTVKSFRYDPLLISKHLARVSARRTH